MSDSVADIALGVFAGMMSGPRPLMPLIAFHAQSEGISSPKESDLAKVIDLMGPNSELAMTLAQRLRLWDHLGSPSWGSGTAANTAARRLLVYSLLAVGEGLTEVLDRRVPPYLEPGPVLITADEVAPWLKPERTAEGYYWNAYTRYLRVSKHWTNLDDLDRSTSAVVANLADPSQVARYQAKGLVVGHVQSGKTANFTGVIAKAADAGYRLFIVLTGTTNILRRQTQRRIDKELLGKEFVAADYQGDPDWEDFAEHGGLPSMLGAFDWYRLTGPEADFRLLGYGSPILDFKRQDPARPPFDPVNLAPTEARILVVKKHAGILGKVTTDLRPYAATLADIPTLVIDDESDQASLDTTKPSVSEERKRTKVNQAIIKLLELLPRAQYVGYTATPFANVFVNPWDATDLFPRDFILALNRPPGYMGASDFHDLPGPPPPGAESNELDFVRSLRGLDDDPDNLLKAMDSFVLAGGIKRFREATLGARFPHHTMLVHVSQGVDDHTAMRDLIERTVVGAAYHSPAGVDRLRRLYESDFRAVSTRRGPSGGLPATFDDLRPFLGSCVDQVFSEKHPVLIVNGQKESDTPDFDRDRVWKILVGGNKLSRGYTIEGLTVSYYRRRAEAADTLMQMGRWFGYREGYKDLVRLFVGREEPKGTRGEVVDLYKAFEGACKDEMAFREELRKYSGLPGEERIRPIQVPPLVQAHLLRPTATSKMYHARLLATNLGGSYREPTVATSDAGDAAANQVALRRMLAGVDLQLVRLVLNATGHTDAFVGVVTPDQVLGFLHVYRWQRGRRPVERDLEFLSGRQFDPAIRDWVVMAPQLQAIGPGGILTVDSTELAVKFRQRDQSGGRYGVYSEPEHVEIAKFIAGSERFGTPNVELRELAADRRAVLLLYPVQWTVHEELVTVGFGLAYPDNDEPRTLIWGVPNPDADDEQS